MPRRAPPGAVIMVATALLFMAAAKTAGAQDTSGLVTGTLNVVWDGNPRAGMEAQYYLTDQTGKVMEVYPATTGVSEATLQSYNRRMVRAQIVRTAGQGASPSTARLFSINPVGMARANEAAASTGERDFVFLLCRFADDPSTPFTTQQVERVGGGTYPGVANFYAELSEDPLIMSGNRVVDWVNLPSPRSAYVTDSTFTTNTSGLARDCTAAADSLVDFTQYSGVAIQVNGALARRSTPPYDTLSLGGSVFLTLDGQARSWGAAWFSASHMGNWVVYSHEIGHGLGWPHSSGKYGQEYDSRWDVMSAAYLNYTAAYGWLTIHTIMPYKSQAGWIPDARILTTPVGASATGTLARSALGGSADYRMARIPISDTSEYVAETRKIAGYDATLPGEAVLIHEVIRGRAYVVDPDNNGNPNDEGAMWRPGEVFVDEAHRISVSVLGAAGTGFSVSIQRGAPPVAITSAATRKAGVVGSAYADTLVASGGLGSFSWTVSGGTLPDGITLGASSGIVSGTPVREGQFSYAATATSAGGTASQTFGMSVYAGVTISSDTVRKIGVTGQTYADTLVAAGATGVFIWTVTGGSLPGGVSLGAGTGIVSGTPTAAGDFRYTVTATSQGASASKAMHLVVANPLMITSDQVRRGAIVGAQYSDTLVATGGTGQIQWSVVDGSLPDGIDLAAGSGVISGLSKKAGSFSVTVRAQSGTLTVTRAFSMLATAPVIQASAVFDQLLGSGTLTSDEIRYLDIVGNGNGRLDVGDVRGWLIVTGQINGSGDLLVGASEEVRALKALAEGPGKAGGKR